MHAQRPTHVFCSPCSTARTVNLSVGRFQTFFATIETMFCPRGNLWWRVLSGSRSVSLYGSSGGGDGNGSARDSLAYPVLADDSRRPDFRKLYVSRPCFCAQSDRLPYRRRSSGTRTRTGMTPRRPRSASKSSARRTRCVRTHPYTSVERRAAFSVSRLFILPRGACMLTVHIYGICTFHLDFCCLVFVLHSSSSGNYFLDLSGAAATSDR